MNLQHQGQKWLGEANNHQQRDKSDAYLLGSLHQQQKKSSSLLFEIVELKKQVAALHFEKQQLVIKNRETEYLQSMLALRNSECQTLKNHLSHMQSILQNETDDSGVVQQQSGMEPVTVRQKIEQLKNENTRLTGENMVLQSKVQRLELQTKGQEAELKNLRSMQANYLESLTSHQGQLLETKLKLTQLQHEHEQLRIKYADVSFTENIPQMRSNGGGNIEEEVPEFQKDNNNNHSDFVLMTNYYLRQNEEYKQKIYDLSNEVRELRTSLNLSQVREMDMNVLVAERNKYLEDYTQLKLAYDKEVEENAANRIRLEREVNSKLTKRLIELRESFRTLLNSQNQNIKNLLDLHSRNHLSFENMKNQILQAAQETINQASRVQVQAMTG